MALRGNQFCHHRDLGLLASNPEKVDLCPLSPQPVALGYGRHSRLTLACPPLSRQALRRTLDLSEAKRELHVLCTSLPMWGCLAEIVSRGLNVPLPD